jgi:UDP-N-acetylmuramate--alanine ligase
MLNILQQAKNIHFIGIGGIGISAIARMLIAQGKQVSGSDSSESEITKSLEKMGAKIFIGQKKENIPVGIDLFIYTVAVKEDNPEFIEAKSRGVKMMTYAQTLTEISKSKYTIAVAGTHGKTTTTAMIAKILIDAGLDPTVIIGSLIRNPVSRESSSSFNGVPNYSEDVPLGQDQDERTNYISGKSKYLVVEACEYERSFLNILPKVAVINNIDADHLDYYGDLDGVISGFREFAQKVSSDGFVVCDPTDEKVAKALAGVEGKIIDRKDYYSSSIKLIVPGEHNRLNAATAIAVAKLLGVETAKALKSLETFSGAWRRFEYKGKTKNGALLYDDYAHNPQKVRAALQGARELFPDKRIVVVFQPHLFSRTKLLLSEFATAFNDADEIILAPIFPAREVFDSTISSEILAEEIKKHNRPVHQNYPSLHDQYTFHSLITKRSRSFIWVPPQISTLTKAGKGNSSFGTSAFSSLVKEESRVREGEVVVLSFKNFSDIESYLKTSLKEGDLLITMGAGEQYKIGEVLLTF